MNKVKAKTINKDGSLYQKIGNKKFRKTYCATVAYDKESKMKMRTIPRKRYYSEKNLKDLMKILTNNMNSYYYIVEEGTHRVIFVNKPVEEVLNGNVEGKLCYEAFLGEASPCSNCPIKYRDEENIIYNEKINKYLEVKSSEVTLLGSRRVFILNAEDVTERKSYKYKIEKLKSTDILLDIPNRLELNRRIAVFKKSRKKGIAVLINIQELSTFNESFGYERGDNLLLSISQHLNEHSIKGQVYRYTGDKFAMFLEDYDEKEAREYLEPVIKRFEKPWYIDGKEYKTNIKVGMADINLDIKNIENIYVYLEFAMKSGGDYLAGKNIVMFNGGEKDKIIRRFFVEDAVENALKYDLFKVHYQPIYNLNSCGFTKAEALLRLIDINGNYISPNEFIPIAEEKSLIVEIGYIVIDKVCKTLREFSDKNINIENINVNISVVQFMENDFVDKVKSIIIANETDPSKLEFEITESILISSFNSITSKMNELREFGIKFALDDFGTGYSSLMYLSQLPINSLKLDRIFVTQLEKQKNIEILIEYVINLAKRLNLNVVVEGVENPIEDSIIRGFKGDYIQGFLYSKPLDEEKFKMFLTK